MTLNQFTLFATVAKHLNVSKASQELRISQPAVSQQLRQLESRYGAKLYRRLSKGVEITEAGHLLLRSIGPILQQAASLEKGFKPVSRSVRGALSVGGTFSAAAILLPSLLKRFRDLHPTAELEFQTGSSSNLERLVAKDMMQLAVTDRKPALPELACERLRREKVLVFVTASHALAHRKSVNLADVLAAPLIVRGGKGISGTTEGFLSRLRKRGWDLNISMRCDGPAAIKAAVREGMGVGIAFLDSIKAELDAGEFKALAVKGFNLEAQSFIVYAKHRPLAPMTREFLELLREARDRK